MMTQIPGIIPPTKTPILFPRSMLNTTAIVTGTATARMSPALARIKAAVFLMVTAQSALFVGRTG
jgi:hypothetical protein